MTKRAGGGQTGLLVFALRVSRLRVQMLYSCVHQFQLLLRGAGQLLDVFQSLFSLKLRKLLAKLFLRLL